MKELRGAYREVAGMARAVTSSALARPLGSRHQSSRPLSGAIDPWITECKSVKRR